MVIPRNNVRQKYTKDIGSFTALNKKQAEPEFSCVLRFKGWILVLINFRFPLVQKSISFLHFSIHCSVHY